MSRIIKGTIGSGPILCACGKRTQARCHFLDGGPHGVCIDCGSGQLVKFPDGGTATRMVCRNCLPLHRSEIWETALLDTLTER